MKKAKLFFKLKIKHWFRPSLLLSAANSLLEAWDLNLACAINYHSQKYLFPIITW